MFPATGQAAFGGPYGSDYLTKTLFNNYDITTCDLKVLQFRLEAGLKIRPDIQTAQADCCPAG